jgi:8-oxo-dGTP pyrophosphatase MutT (NUDIX family)
VTSSPPNAPIARVGGRALLVDPHDRVLLIHEEIEGAGRHWLTPGGGLDPDEHPRDAAVREALEETGIAVRAEPDAEAVHVTRRLWSWRHLTYDQVDHFFLFRVPATPDPAPASLTDIEQQTFIEMRWWTVEELRATNEVLLPPDLADLVARLLAAESQAEASGQGADA